MGLKEDLKAAQKAQDKLARYCAGLPKNADLTAKYYELNAKADVAIKKLPPGVLRSKMALDLSRLLR